MENILWTTHFTLAHNCSEHNFWDALEIWNKSPNLVNKRIFGVSLFNLGEYNSFCSINDIITDISKENCESLNEYFENKLKCVTRKEEMIIDKNNYQIFAKVILYKRDELNSFEITVFDKDKKIAIFLEPSSQIILYGIQFKENEIELKIPLGHAPRKEMEWYCHVLLPKLVKWMQNNSSVYNTSISLVPIDQYKSLYVTLKKKYSSDIKKIWTEVTDPDKFVHEDIAIATYILLLWKDKPPRRYVDLGCGNGLLVHILNGEGHLGIGYDLRSRKIWSKYPQTTVLKVTQIKPSKELVFPEADWIIGNHSDELTPWIPVIATFSSPHTDFFLLPCCAYEFDGSKFRRNNSAKSLYNDYLDYVEKICLTCGFKISRDRLRIPSTKRICFVSRGRNYEMSDFDCIKHFIDQFIENSSNSKNEHHESWGIDVKLRDSDEKVRNCTQIDQNLKVNIVNSIAQILLKDSHNVNSWNEGTPRRIEEIIRSLPSDYLKQLKNEGKGLQTFIKNHHHIFKLDNGSVNFRKPTATVEVKFEKWKMKACWFYENHPNSCPLKDEKCSYRHSASGS